jgi:hypothetical protein
MTELDYLLYAIGVAGAFYLGMRYAEYRMIKKMIDMMTPEERAEIYETAQKIKSDLEKAGIRNVAVHTVDEDDVVNLKHEVMDNVHFLYRDGNTFVCQGPSIDSVARRFAEIMGENKVGVVNMHDGSNALIIAGVLKGGGEVK